MSFTPETLLRQWQTLRLLPRFPRKTTSADLLVRLEGEGYTVTKRTVERDLHSLSRIFPLRLDERSKPFGWSWDQDAPAFNLPGLSGSEALTLLMARDHLRSVMPSQALAQMAPYFRQAEASLQALVGHSSLAAWQDKVRVVPPTQPLLAPSIDGEVLAAVQTALLEGHQCQVTYLRRGSPTADSYPVNPLGLIQRGQVLYLVATIKTHSDVRLLALHRIRQAEPLETEAHRLPGFSLDAYLDSGAMGWGDGGNIRLELLFTSQVGTHLYETPLASDQVIVVDTDGALHVTATVPANQQLTWWILGFGDSVEVLAPQEMRESIAKVVRQTAAKYTKEPR